MMKHGRQYDTLVINGENLTLEDVRDVAVDGRKIAIAADARERMEESYALVGEILRSGEPVYGISTGFGEFSRVHLSDDQNVQLQLNLIRSHASGTGKPFDEKTVRAIMLMRLNALCVGFSGINPDIADLLVSFLNLGVTPIIPEQGSLGASGDLANLAHMSLVLIGEGRATVDGIEMDGREALARRNLNPVRLCGKDGLALINGTAVMLGVGTLAYLEAEDVLHAANGAAALTFEALHGFRGAYDRRIHELRRKQGQIEVASTMRGLLEGSEYADSRLHDVQDAYTLRCIPQVHGASLDAMRYVREVLQSEANAVTDNPLVFTETSEVISGGNFHGQPLALALDFLGIAVAELANISERRTERLVNPQLSGLPAFLVKNGGVQSGFMIPQYVAASLVSENKVLAHPASVDSIPSSANKEDHVSMGAFAARKAGMIVANSRRVIAIELMCAAQAIDLQERRQLGRGTRRLYELVRRTIPVLTEDRPLSSDIETIADLIAGGYVTDALYL
ncbi:MAG: histidine ammonia-lyase [Saccharofermentanales bacterium]